MTSGLKAFLISLLLLVTAVPARTDWDLQSLSRALAGQTDARVDFREERRVAYLTENLLLSGYVVRKGDRLEKHVLEPITESFVIDGDQVEVETAQGEYYRLDLDDHPMLKGLALALRAGLSGDFTNLDDTFDMHQTGDAAHWTLHLVPHKDQLRAELREVTLSGIGGNIDRIRIEGVNGDTSEMKMGPAEQ
ncbi:MAG: LolA-related protein [Rhodospirillales bacterium]